MTKYIDADALKRWIQAECNPYGAPTLDYASSVKIMERIDKMPPQTWSRRIVCSSTRQIKQKKRKY